MQEASNENYPGFVAASVDSLIRHVNDKHPGSITTASRMQPRTRKSEMIESEVQFNDLTVDGDPSRTPFERLFYAETAWRRSNADDTNTKIGKKVIVDIICDAAAGRSFYQEAVATHSWNLLGHEWAVVKVTGCWDDDLGADTDEGFIGCSFLIDCGRSEPDRQAHESRSLPIFDALAGADEHTREFLLESQRINPASELTVK